MPALLVKELTEQANRRRTYVLRGLVAAGLFLAFLIPYQLAVRMDYNGNLPTMLGRGRVIFDALVYGCLGAVLFLVPGMTAAALTEEKESGTLPLLLLSRIGLRGIILQKWLARIITGGSLLLPALPLGAIAYACGGVEPEVLGFGLALIAVTLGWTTAVGLAASAWCRSTVGSFMLTYCVVGGLCALGFIHHRFDNGSWLDWFCPPVIFNISTESYRFQRGSPNSSAYMYATLVFPMLVGTVLLLIGSLAVARRRAEITSRPIFMRLFAWLDHQAVALDQRFFRRTATVDLPVSSPVRWREVHGRSILNYRYLVRWFIPVFVILLLIIISNGSKLDRVLGPLTLIVMSVGLMVMTVRGAVAFAAERSNQTLAVLLTTPMTAAALVRDKMAGMRRLHLAIMILIGLLLLFRVLCSEDPSRNWLKFVYYYWFAPLTIAATIIIPAIVGWWAMLISLLVVRRTYAIIVALVVVSMLLLGAPFALVLLIELTKISQNRDIENFFMPLFPAILPIVNEIEAGGRDDRTTTILIMWCILQPLHYVAIRWYCVYHADRWLRRRA